MKADDLGFFQKHAEKLALGLGLLVLAAAGVTQFLGQPNAVELNNQSVAPDELEDAVTSQVDRLKGKLAGPTFVDPIDIPDYTRSFGLLYQLPVAASNALAGLFDSHGLAAADLIRDDVKYPNKYLPSPPLPVENIAKSGHGVLDDQSDPQLTVALREIIGEQTPADFPWVTVSAEFEFDQWQLRLEAAGRPESERIPQSLWSKRMAVTSVYLIREELDPVTGRWGNKSTIHPLPGQFAILPDNTTKRTQEEATGIEVAVKQNQRLIRLPAFPEITNGPWTPPDISNKVFSAEELEQQRKLEKRISILENMISRMTGTERRDAGERAPRRQPDGFDPGAFEEFGQPERRQPRRDNRAAAGGQTAEDRRLADMVAELQEKRAALDALLGIDSTQQGFDRPMPGDVMDEPFMGPDQFGQPGQPGFGAMPSQKEKAVDVPAKVKVWAHDLSVEPGKTYRYKVVCSVLNPLYRQSRLNAKQKQENFDRVSLGPSDEEITDSAWSAPLTLDPKHYFFAVGGSADDRRITFEVWTIYDGIWRNVEVKELPGNEIGDMVNVPGVAGIVPMNVGKILLDVDTVSGGGVGGSGSVLRALYLDPTTGRIESRMVDRDKKSDERKRLENEQRLAEEAQRVQLGAGASPF